MPLGNTITETLQNAAVANGPGTVVGIEGYETCILLIDNGAGSCTVNVEGSLDPAFANAQRVFQQNVVLQSTNAGGTSTANVGQGLVAGALAVAANTSYQYQLYANLPVLRARISAAAGLGAGTAVTGCTVTCFRKP